MATPSTPAEEEEHHGFLHGLVDKVEDLVLHHGDEASSGAAADGTAALPSGQQTTVPPNGNKKALLVGINYLTASKGRLNGCINDVNNVAQFLQSNCGYTAARMRVLTDDQPNNMPTAANILASFAWLVEGAVPGDCLFFHYSGHGGQVGGSFLEDDGKNETILPVDYERAGQIKDSHIYDALVRPLPAGVRLTAIFDSCHSGTVMDLPYIYKSTRHSDAHKDESQPSFLERHMSGWGMALAGGLTGIATAVVAHAGSELVHQGSKVARHEIAKALNTSDADVYMLSGCRDEQTSADTSVDGVGATGAMSYSFISALQQQPNQNWGSLVDNMRDILVSGPKKYTQVPQLSMGHPTDPATPVYI
mmetsp:Transcript_11222/g.45651  ORF Transcript_11222/g.45651 Transcript_11222/m.45651 type:complete len:363 (+) Transcript_11222:40-1128(+)